MAGVIPYVIDLAMLRAGVLDLGSVTLRLFVNDYTPTKADTAAEYTEAAGAGYAPKTLLASNWSFVLGPPPYSLYAQQSFGFTGMVGDVFGYYLLKSDGDLAGAERFSDGPYPVLRAGDIVRVTPKIAAILGE